MDINQWKGIATDSTCIWAENIVLRQNGMGVMYYSGSENGIYVRVHPEGKLEIGSYHGAKPKIINALFTIITEQICGSYDKALEMACDLCGVSFSRDILSYGQSQQEKDNDPSEEKNNQYYPINEEAARRAKEANSFYDYKPGSATELYCQYVDTAAKIAEQQKARVDPMYHEKIDRLLDT